MFWTAFDMSSGILGSASGLLGPISGRFEYFTVFIQLRLHCNTIFNWINYSDCCKGFGQHLTCLRVSWGPHRASSGLYRANSNILQYLFNWDYIARNYWSELIIQTVINVLDSIRHVFGHPAVTLGPPRAYIGWIGIFCSIYSIGVTLQWNIQLNSLFRLS
jgi:hypothetical protein